jgi:type II secretory pathway pseudopilin PulG
MALGIALILIFVLFLIDKHNRWRQAIKITVALIILAILGVGGLFGWQEYETWQSAKQEAQREAEQAKQVAQKQAELAKTCKDWEDKHPVGSPLDKENIKEDGKKTPTEFVLDPPQDCAGPLETDYNKNVAAWVALSNPPKPTPDHVRRVRALYGFDLTTKELGELKCGAVKAGEVVILLEDGRVNGIRVKTTDGQIGWAPESVFEVVK